MRERQKLTYDRSAKECTVKVGQRVMVHMPSELQGKTWKFARPYHGPFRVLNVTPTNAEVRLVDDPKSDSMFVSLTRVRPCHDELPDTSWRGSIPRKYGSRPNPPIVQQTASYSGPMTRSRTQAGN